MNPFSNVNPKMSFQEAYQLLAIIEDAQKIEKESQTEDQGLEDQEDNVAALRKNLKDIENQFSLVNSLLERVYESNEGYAVPEVKKIATEACKDYKSAYDLTIYYSKEWFSRFFVSLDAKIDFANTLLDLVKPFEVPNTECWQMIVDNNPDMLEYISAPHVDLS